MIYIGVDFINSGFSVTALSPCFSLIEEEKFFQNTLALQSWLAGILLDDAEQVFWFFCENEFHANRNIATLFFSIPTGDHSHYLVKDRLIHNQYHLIRNIFSCKNWHFALEKSHILAASRGFIDSEFISCFNDLEPFGEF
ncbi:MAG: hypothetical protein JW755_00185, partial [Candidatus Aminicenantes bacterium]|nr:hypothetical protein [Candidatus Aminicenantes bacterium]